MDRWRRRRSSLRENGLRDWLGQMGGLVDRWVGGWVVWWMDGWMGGWVGGWVGGRTYFELLEEIHGFGAA